MRVLKLGEGIKLTKCECYHCKSKLQYTPYDIKKECGNWFRTGTESSARSCSTYIVCPVCGHSITLSSWGEEQ